MESLLGPFLVGVICIVLGITNMRGNISTIHSYHRHRVAEEDRIPFGKKVGLGTVIAGAAIVAYSGFSALDMLTGHETFIVIGTAVLIVGLVGGLGLSIYAIIKYNKGLF